MNITKINGIEVSKLGEIARDAIVANPLFPYRTGNLMHNATYVGTDGVTIVFDEVKAPYILYLEYGTRRSKKHVGFIRWRAVRDAEDAIAAAIGGRILS